MRDSYLLAAGLLTGLTIPGSSLPQMVTILPDKSQSQWDLKQRLQSTTTEKNILIAETTLPEFSSQELQPQESLQPILGTKNIPSLLNIALPEFSNSVSQPDEKNLPSDDIPLLQFNNQEPPASRNSLLNPDTQSPSLPLTSGNQLYYQRLAALKTGQIYTRTDAESSSSLGESSNKHQLTYEDWKSLLALEAKAIAQGQGKNRLSILVGDSLSMWFPKEKLPTGTLWLNQGISGDTSSGIVTRLTAFSQTRPDAIYIMAGINDLRKGASDETILRNYSRIIRRLRQTHPQTKIIIQSILPTRVPTISNSRIYNLNAKLALIAKQEKANYLNIYTWFTDFQGNLRSELTTDGLHLSQDGYDVWRFAIEQMEFKLTQRQN